jgi:hypothetical protein
MKTDKELLEELKAFAKKFEEYNIFSYEDGAYFNGLGSDDIDDEDWDAFEELREEFEAWVDSNGFSVLGSQKKVDISFCDSPEIRVFSQIKYIG